MSSEVKDTHNGWVEWWMQRRRIKMNWNLTTKSVGLKNLNPKEKFFFKMSSSLMNEWTYRLFLIQIPIQLPLWPISFIFTTELKGNWFFNFGFRPTLDKIPEIKFQVHLWWTHYTDWHSVNIFRIILMVNHSERYLRPYKISHSWVSRRDTPSLPKRQQQWQLQSARLNDRLTTNQWQTGSF